MSIDVDVHLATSSGSRLVGRLLDAERRVHFQYDAAFLKSGLELSPFKLSLRKIEGEAQKVFEGHVKKVLPDLELAGGSPGGARPKVVVGVGPGDTMVAGANDVPPGFEHWLIKFAARDELEDAGPLEETYAQLARSAGIDMPETRLFPLDRKRRAFGVRRFDRIGNRRVHVHTIGGLLHASHRLPSLDYQTILSATFSLTQDRQQALEAFRRSAFNVLACNRDDHDLMDERVAAIAKAVGVTAATRKTVQKRSAATTRGNRENDGEGEARQARRPTRRPRSSSRSALARRHRPRHCRRCQPAASCSPRGNCLFHLTRRLCLHLPPAGSKSTRLRHSVHRTRSGRTP